jgi:hypothetical protein
MKMVKEHMEPESGPDMVHHDDFIKQHEAGDHKHHSHHYGKHKESHKIHHDHVKAFCKGGKM